jgi:hypothetical protein
MTTHNNDVFVVEEADVNEALDMEKAKEVGEKLNEIYPGHLWAVAVQGGVLVVKNLAISSFYGFVIKHADSHSSFDLAHQAVIAGGELLERAGIPRDRPWDGRMAQKLEGSEPRFFQPLGE